MKTGIECVIDVTPTVSLEDKNIKISLVADYDFLYFVSRLGIKNMSIKNTGFLDTGNKYFMYKELENMDNALKYKILGLWETSRVAYNKLIKKGVHHSMAKKILCLGSKVGITISTDYNSLVELVNTPTNENSNTEILDTIKFKWVTNG